MPGKKILMLVGDFTEEYEIFVFEQGMCAVGHTVHVVCPDKRAGDVLKTSLHDFEGDQTYTEKLGHNHILNKTFAEVNPAEYDAVYSRAGAARNTSASTAECRTSSATSTRRTSRSSRSVTACKSSSR